MIDETLNRDRMLDLAKELVEHAGREPAPAGEEERVLREAIAILANSFVTQPARGDAVGAESREAFIPTDAALSLLQAMYEQELHERGDAVAERSEAGPLASERRTVGGDEEGVGPFENLDPRWAIRFLVTLARYVRRRRKFELPFSPPRPFTLADDARVVLVGDWGTGERMARNVAGQIRAALFEAGDRETHVVHLGDVYYAGTRWEAEHRFLPIWPVDPDEATRHRSWCLNANHDMYAAGEGLFEVILRDERFAAQVTQDGRPTSEFQLAGDRWQILGLDTAWKLRSLRLDDLRGHSGHISDEQAQWLTTAASGGPPVILLSHHQPFSRRRAGADGIVREGNLFGQTAALRASPGLGAWFWGHEHRCMTYGARDGIGYAACVGHGAVPSLPRPSAADAGEWELTDTWQDADGERWRKCGFAIIDLSPDAVTVRYVDHEGSLSKPPDTFSRA